MAKFDYDLIVIGGGAAGLTASTGAGRLGAKVLLVEKEKTLGGDCLHFGCVPSKSLIKSASVYSEIRNAARYGLPEMSVPPVDFSRVRERIRGIISAIQLHDSPEWLKRKYNVDTRFGPVRFFDPHTIELAGEKITARNFFIATGSSPSVPPVPGLDSVPYLTNKDIFSLERLPPSMTVLGGGPIGLEMAQAFSRLGSRVTVVEAADQVLPREDEDVAALVEKILKSEGVRILTKARAVRAAKKDGGVLLAVESAGWEEDLHSEALLVAVVRRPNTEGLDLGKAGVVCDSKGIPVDGRLRTSAKHIYAIGDVNGSYPFTHVAGYEGGTAMVNAIMRLPVKADYSKVPWCTYLDPEVASIGHNEKRAREAGLDFKIQREEFKDNDRALAEGAAEGFMKILIGKGDRVLGVQIVGPRAGELIHEWVAALNGRVGLSTLAQAIHAYPTLSEINKRASGDWLAPKLFNDLARRVLKAAFGLQGKASGWED
ncbi:MAG: mercuric reductase [Candidatus Omnitrophota bacterium]|nr:mercuric reductase [Candidatus Omnitrophota bacterium]MDZ4242343.1 mercuric reductase [Candidatus Omnitrophota bacterium]